jgi:hypothetical protein
MQARQRLASFAMVATGVAIGVGVHLLPDADARVHKLSDTVGTLDIQIRDDANKPVPARLTFIPVDGTSTPAVKFTTVDIAKEETGAVAAFDRAFVLRGDAEIRIPAGTYDIWFSHGMEWDTSRERVTVQGGATVDVDVKLHHVIDTPGWISGDFHVHAAPSFDSRVPLRDRVHQFVADGVDLIVSTDHNVVSDYGPVITELGVGDLLASATGDEITSKPWGHFGAFPLPVDDSDVGRGAPATGQRTARAIFADVRGRAPHALIDVHHPRLENGGIGYFHLAGLDQRTGQATKAGFSFDFDALEVLNGYQDPDRKTLDRVIGDWIAFLDAGMHIAATGNSDSHHMTFNLGGFPRNYVVMPDGPLAQLDAQKVAAQVKAGCSYVTTGPILDVTIGGAHIGQTITVKGGDVAVKITVRAAPWITATKLTLIGPAGAVLASQAIPVSTNVVRFDATIPVHLERDGYVIVRVDGDRPMAPNIGDEAGFKVYPFALANPIWIDVDGDGASSPRSPYKLAEQPGE